MRSARVLRLRDRNVHGEYAVRLEAKVYAAQQDEALQHQSRADQQHQRECNFASHQQPAPAQEWRRPRSALYRNREEQVAGSAPDASHAGATPNSSNGPAADHDREEQHRKIERGRSQTRNGSGRQADQQAIDPHGGDQADAASAERQQSRLHQHLAHHARPPRTPALRESRSHAAARPSARAVNSPHSRKQSRE